jgi:hypothetical protein
MIIPWPFLRFKFGQQLLSLGLCCRAVTECSFSYGFCDLICPASALTTPTRVSCRHPLDNFVYPSRSRRKRWYLLSRHVLVSSRFSSHRFLFVFSPLPAWQDTNAFYVSTLPVHASSFLPHLFLSAVGFRCAASSYHLQLLSAPSDL